MTAASTALTVPRGWPERRAACHAQAVALMHRIEVPTTQHAGQTLLRVSVQACNAPADLRALESALAAAPGRA